MLDVARAGNQIVSGHLDAIRQINDETYRRKMERLKLEEQAMQSHAKLQLQEELYESRINSEAARTSTYVESAKVKAEQDNREAESAALKQHLELLDEDISSLEMRKLTSELNGEDTTEIDARLKASQDSKNAIQQRMLDTLSGTLQQPQFNPAPTPQRNIELPGRNLNTLGYNDLSNAGEETFQRNPLYGTQTPAVAEGYSPVPDLPPVEVSDSAHTFRADVDYDGTPANIRYNNPAAAYPRPADNAYALEGYGIIGGGHKIGKYPTVVHGGASNMDLLANSYKGLTVRQAVNKWRGRGGTPIPEGYEEGQVINDDFVSNKDTMVDFFKKMADHEHPDFEITRETWGAAYDMFAAGGDKEYREAVGLITKQSTNEEPSSRATSVAGVDSGNGEESMVDASLFPAQSRPEPLRAEPVFFGPAEQELSASVGFFEDGPLIINDQTFAPAAEKGLIINDDFTSGNIPATATPEPPLAGQTEKKETVTKDSLSKIWSAASKMDPKKSSLFLSQIRDIVTNKKPDVFDDEYTAYAESALNAGQSRTDFAKAIPAELTAFTGPDRAIAIFSRVEGERIKKANSDKRMSDLRTELDDASKTIGNLDVELAKEKGKGKDANLGLIKVYENQRDGFVEKQRRIASELEGLLPKPSLTEPSQAVPTESSAPVDPVKKQADDLVNSILSQAPATSSPTVSEPFSFGGSLANQLTELGISKDRLLELELPKEKPGLFGSFFGGLGLNPELNSLTNGVIGAYMATQRDELLKLPAEQQSKMAEAAASMLERNTEAVFDLAVTLGYKVPITRKSKELGNGVFDFSQYATIDAMSVDDPSFDPKQEAMAAAKTALLANPAYLIPLLKASTDKGFQAKVRQSVMNGMTKAAEEQRTREAIMLGIPADL